MFKVERSGAQDQCFMEAAEIREMSSHFGVLHSALM